MRPHASLVLLPAALLALAGCSEYESPTGVAAPNPVAARLLLAPATSPGTIVAWGSDLFGLVSNAPADSDFVAVAAGSAHVTALRENGSLVSWGNDIDGVVSSTPADSDFVAVATKSFHSTALRENGSLVSWGNNTDGVVSSTPADSDFVAVAVGGLHVTALRENGSLISWGNDVFGQVSETPADSDFVAVAAGGFHFSTALRENGSLVSWGDDVAGVVTNTPDGDGFVAVAAGASYVIALGEDGTLVSWGDDRFRLVSETPDGDDFIAVAAGWEHSTAVREGGSLVSWGNDPSGQVSETPDGNGFVAVAGGLLTGVAIQVAAADELAPVIQITSPADGATYVIGQQVLADYACTDEDGGSGLASCTASAADGEPLDTEEVGTKTFVVDAADEAGNTATLTHTYTVVYGFGGFFPPVKNDGEFNKAKAGRTIPLKWRLIGADGQPVTDLSSVNVTVEDMACALGGTADELEESAPGSSGLQNLGDGYYQLNWKTPNAYARSCKALHLDLDDGLTRTALFRFTK